MADRSAILDMWHVSKGGKNWRRSEESSEVPSQMKAKRQKSLPIKKSDPQNKTESRVQQGGSIRSRYLSGSPTHQPQVNQSQMPCRAIWGACHNKGVTPAVYEAFLQ